MRTLTRLSTILLASGLALCGLGTPAEAAVPGHTVIEGVLGSAGGGPAADGNYAVVFSIYKDEMGGNPVYTEGPVTIGVKNGQWTHQLGSKVALSPAALAGLSTAWLGIKVESDAELPRKAMSSVAFSLRAAVAEGLECSGCVGAGQIDAKVLEPYAKTASLSKVALSGKFEDLSGGPDLSAYTKTADLAKVALSGAYADLSGVPDLSAYAKVASLHKVAGTGSFKDLVDLPTMATVATSGEYKDLKNAPVVPAVGKSCGTGLVVKGLKADGSLECVQAMDPSGLPADGIDEISNGLIANQFTDTVAGKPDIGIPDNNPLGVGDTITFPDIGIAQKLTVSVDISNSDISKLKVFLYDPNNTEYILYNEGSTGGSLVTSYPDPTTPIKGDLTAWVGKNPQGKWSLKVLDTAFKNNGTDGAINKWSINLQTLSSKKVQIKGDLIVDGNVTLGAGSTIKGLPSWPTLRWGRFSTYSYAGNWYYGNSSTWTLGIAPSTWTDGAARIWSISANKSLWRTVLTQKMNIYPTMTVMSEEWYDQSSTNGKVLIVLFRIKNTTGSAINWSPAFWHTNFGSHSECSSLTVNGAGTWDNCGNCYGWNCNSQPTLSIPANRVSSVMMAITSGGPQPMRSQILTFYNDTLKLPSGLEYVDDLDTASGGWEQ